MAAQYLNIRRFDCNLHTFNMCRFDCNNHTFTSASSNDLFQNIILDVDICNQDSGGCRLHNSIFVKTVSLLLLPVFFDKISSSVSLLCNSWVLSLSNVLSCSLILRFMEQSNATLF